MLGVFFFFSMAYQPLGSQGQASRSHSETPHSVWLLWTSGQTDTQSSTRHHTTLTIYIHAPGGFESTIPANERPQTHALDCAATGMATLTVTGWTFYHCAYISWSVYTFVSGISWSLYTFVSGTWAHTLTMSWTSHGRCRIFRSDVHPCRFSYPETLLCIFQQTTFGPSSMAGHVTSSCSRCQSSSVRLELEAI